jgi:predicted nucleotidyltransferase
MPDRSKWSSFEGEDAPKISRFGPRRRDEAAPQELIRLYTPEGAAMRPDSPASDSLTKEAILRRLRESYPQLSAQFGVQRIGLFGSFARDTAQASSDVDLIVELQHPIGLQFMELVEYLETLLGRKVDVLTLAGLRGIRLPEVAKRIEESLVHV